MCKMCEDRIWRHSGSKPKCAFPDGVFVIDNWNCAAIDALIEIGESERLIQYCDDCCLISLICPGVSFNEETNTDGECGGFIILSRYKNHGSVQKCLFVNDEELKPATFEQVKRCIAYYGDKK